MNTQQLASRTGLPEQALEQICAVLARETDISHAVLYGSRARGTAQNTSDIDIALASETLTQADKARIEAALDDLLLPWKIDLCLLSSVTDEQLLKNIRQDGVSIFHNAAQQIE